jgi:hypothetical protein
MKYLEKLTTIFFSALIAFLLVASSRGLIKDQTRSLSEVEVKVLTLYDVCVEGTLVPAARLQAHARAESDELDSAIGDGGLSRSRFQLYEVYHAYRAEKYGEYDINDPAQAGRTAALFIQDTIYAFPGDPEMQMTAYRWGIEGARQRVADGRGPDMWYVERVMNARARI